VEVSDRVLTLGEIKVRNLDHRDATIDIPAEPGRNVRPLLFRGAQDFFALRP
jgi:hypothetical protein